MFSNDQNVETIGRLVDICKHYIGLQTEYVKLDVIEKVVRLLTAIAILLSVVGLLAMAAIYLSFAAAYALASVVGMTCTFLIVGGIYVVLLFLIIILRHRLIERPLVKFLAHLLMSK